MNTSGEAADQVVRMSMEVGEAALKISGAGAKQLAVLLYTILKEKEKTKGRAKLETLVRSGKPLTVFSVKESDLKKFVQEAKRYGILYCAVRDRKRNRDGMVDIMVREEDAPRINRIVERFQFASVTETAQIRSEIEKSREEKSPAKPQSQTEVGAAPREKDRPVRSKEDQLVDELLGAPMKKEDTKEKNPSVAKDKPFFGKARTSRPSEPISEKQGRTDEGTSKLYKPVSPERPSVREQLREIRGNRGKGTETPKRKEIARGKGNKNQKALQHKQPQAKRKSKKWKER